MPRRFSRQLTPTERVYLINAELSPPFANQIIFEGSGELDPAKWKRAVEVAAEANPGTRLVLRGALALARWVDSGQAPPVREVDGSRWSGMDPEGAPFLRDPLPATGPTCEVLLIRGNPLRVAFRSHHAVMDGRGTFIWADEVFRALRGERSAGNDSAMTEHQAARSFQKKGRVPPPHTFIAPTGMPSEGGPGFTWRRIQLPGSYPDALARIALAMAHEAWSRCDGAVRIAVPVDLRPRVPGLRNTGNITNLVYLDVAKNDTPETIARKMKRNMDEKRDGELYWGDALVRFLPLGMIRSSLKKEIARKLGTGLYRNSGVISNMGRVPAEYFSGGGFNATGLLGIPPSIDVVPFFIGTAGLKTHLELILSMPNALAGGGRIEQVMKRLAEELKPAPPKETRPT
jgi:hypothetical protein